MKKIGNIRPLNKTKFNVDKDTEKRTYCGIVFDSVMEMKYYRDWVLPRVRSGEITKVELQKAYELQPKFDHGDRHVNAITYVADFVLEYKDGHIEVIDTKGFPDSVAKIKRKMFWYVYPDLDYKWICYSKTDGNEENGGWCDYEYVAQQRKLRKKPKERKD